MLAFADDSVMSIVQDTFIVVPASQTLRDALALLTEQNGQEWWYLVVERGNGGYLAARFSNLRERLKAEGSDLLDSPLTTLEGSELPEAVIIGWGLTADEARKVAQSHVSGIAVVVWNGAVLGLVDVGRTRQAMAFGEASMSEMASASSSQGLARHAAPPPPSPAPATGLQLDSLSVGDVGGNVNVAGGDIVTHVHNYAPTPDETRDQPRRFEAAFPSEVHVGVDERIYVAVLLPDAPSPFGLEPDEKPKATESSEEVAIAMPVDRATGQLRKVDLDVTVTATGIKTEGQSTKTLTVWPDGRPAIRWFQLEPQAAGSQTISIEIEQDGSLLTEIELQTTVVDPQAKPRSALSRVFAVIASPLGLQFANAG